MNCEDTIEYIIKCSLEDLYFGKHIKFKINRKIIVNKNFINQSEILEIKIPPGCIDGTKIFFEKKDDLQKNIVFKIKQVEHKIFKRNKDNLIATCIIGLDEVFKGFTRTIKLLNNKTEIINIQKLNNSNDTINIKNGGMPIQNNDTVTSYGDLIIEFKINFENIPNKINKFIIDEFNKIDEI